MIMQLVNLPSKRRERSFRESEHSADARDDHDEPDGVHRRLGVRIHLLPIPRSRERVVARERKHNTGCIHALRGTCYELRKRLSQNEIN